MYICHIYLAICGGFGEGRISHGDVYLLDGLLAEMMKTYMEARLTSNVKRDGSVELPMMSRLEIDGRDSSSSDDDDLALMMIQ